MARFPQDFAQGEPVPEIGIGRVGNRGVGADQKKQVGPEEKSYPCRGHGDSATQKGMG